MAKGTGDQGNSEPARRGGIGSATIGFGERAAPAPRQPVEPDFEVLVLAPFGITGAASVQVDLSTDFNTAMASAAPRFACDIGRGGRTDWLTLEPKSLRDLSPPRLALHLPAAAPSDPPAPDLPAPAPADDSRDGEADLDALSALVDIDASESKHAGSLLDDFVDSVRRESRDAPTQSSQPAKPGADPATMAALLTDPGFCAFDAAWRGARFLASRADFRAGMRLTLANLPTDIAQLDAALFAAADLVIVDHAFTDTPADGKRLEALMVLGENERAAIVANVDDQLLTGAPDQTDPGQSFLDARSANWHALRGREEAAWLALCWNDMALADAGSRAGHALWGGAAWLLAAAAIDSHKRHGWPVAVDRWVEGLDVIERGGGGRRCASPLRYDLDRAQIADLASVGISAAAAPPDRDRAVYPQAVTVQREARIAGDSGGARSRRMVEFGHTLALARILNALEHALPRWRAQSPEGALAEAERFANALIGDTGPNAGYAAELRQAEGRQILELSLKGGDTLLPGDSFSFDLPLA